MIAHYLNDASEWVADRFIDGVVYVGKKIYEYSDIALIISVVLLVLAMFGSKRAGKGTYWTLAIYLVIQMLGLVL